MNKRVLVGVFVILFGIIISIFGFKTLNELNNAKNWNKTLGVITYSGTEQSSVSLGKGGYKSIYYANISFNYSVNGVNYSSDRATLTKTSGNYRELLDKYPANKTVDVYYDSNDPGNSILEINFNWNDFVLPIVGIIFIILGLIALIKRED